MFVMGLAFLFANETMAASDWKPRQIEIVISNPVGGGQDIQTRIIGEAMSKYLDIPFTYNNKKGASGQIGYMHFLSRPKDGTYLLSSNLSSSAIMYKNQHPAFDWDKELEWLGIMSIDPGVFFTRADSQFKTLKDAVEEAKKRTVTVGISYWASPDNLLVQQIAKQTGAKFEIIPYGAANDIVTQVLGGHVEFAFAKVGVTSRVGDSIRYLGLAMRKNTLTEIIGDVPTVDEQLGIQTLEEASYRCINIHTAFKKQYPERYALLKKAFEAVKDDPAVIEAMKKVGVSPALMVDWTPEQLKAQTRSYWDAYDSFSFIYDKKDTEKK